MGRGKGRGGGRERPVVVREEDGGDEGGGAGLRDIPRVEEAVKKEGEGEGEGEGDVVISDDDDDEGDEGGGEGGAEGEGEEKKKLRIDTSYDGFAIYGRILCLVVKRRGGGAARGRELAGGAGQAMMEEWIAGTQVAEGE